MLAVVLSAMLAYFAGNLYLFSFICVTSERKCRTERKTFTVEVKCFANIRFVSAVSSMKPNMDSSNCILVQDVKDVTNDQITMGSESTQLPTEGNKTHTLVRHGSYRIFVRKFSPLLFILQCH